ncbi:hypothetical protein AB1N83_007561 [Pleurotus pulmonarius]
MWRARYQAFTGNLSQPRATANTQSNSSNSQALVSVLRHTAQRQHTACHSVASFKNVPVPFDSTTPSHSAFYNISNGHTTLNPPQEPPDTLIFGTSLRLT